MAGVHSALAPESSRTVGQSRLRLGMGVAMAGRITLGRRPIRSRAEAIVAPVFPADTMAMALPSRTASAARTREESFFLRTPCPGSSSMPMTSLAGKHGRSPVSPISPGRPTRATLMPVCSATCRAPATICVGGPVAAHGVDHHRKCGQRVAGRPCDASRH